MRATIYLACADVFFEGRASQIWLESSRLNRCYFTGSDVQNTSFILKFLHQRFGILRHRMCDK
jgi:hypothetical protein